jgi:hypothetical protein
VGHHRRRFGSTVICLGRTPFLRDSIFNEVSLNPKVHWHRPIIITDTSTPLGGVIGRLKVKPEHPEDDVVDNDLILVWGEKKRIITGADLLGRLLRGIVTQDVRRAVDSRQIEHAVPGLPT